MHALLQLRLDILEFKKVKFKFPEKMFNNILTSKINNLNRITKDGMVGIKRGGAKFIADIYLEMMDAYSYLYKEILSFIPPKKGAQYIKSFKKSMEGVAGPLLLEISKLKLESQNVLAKNKILSDSGSKLFSSSKKYTPYLNIGNSLLMMDKAKRR